MVKFHNFINYGNFINYCNTSIYRFIINVDYDTLSNWKFDRHSTATFSVCVRKANSQVFNQSFQVAGFDNSNEF